MRFHQTRNKNAPSLYTYRLTFATLATAVFIVSSITVLTVLPTLELFYPNLTTSNDAILSPSSSKSKPGGVFTNVLPSDWRGWLASHNGTTELNIQQIKKSSVQHHLEWGCGVSIPFLFETHQQPQSPIPSFNKTFFKAAHMDMSYVDGESHLREIKAYYLDQILQTNVVLPCSGYRLYHSQIVDADKWKAIENFIECVGKKNKTVVEGSMMLWMNDLNTIPKEKISEKISKEIYSSEDQQDERQSAMNYAIFHYIGACFKSPHNHFVHNGVSHKTYVAIDNDRCITPKAVSTNSSKWDTNKFAFWEKLVYKQICHVQHHQYPVVQVVLDATTSLSTKKRTTKISSRLWEDVQLDELSSVLVETEPETFLEIDERVNTLAEYIRENCPHEEEEKKVTFELGG